MKDDGKENILSLLEDMTHKELEELLSIVKKKIEQRKEPNLVEIHLETDGWYDPRKHGHAYVAFIKRDENGKIKREFVSYTNRVYDTKHKSYKAEWIFKATVGTIIEARLYGGSWKNEYRYYYRVTKDGLKDITREEALGL